MKRIVAGAGWGVLIYAVMYLAWSGLVIYGLSVGVGSLVARVVLLALVTTIATRSLRISTVHDLIPCAALWAFTALLLDTIFLVPFTGWALFSSWSVWAGYVLIVVAPVLTMTLSRSRSEARTA